MGDKDAIFSVVDFEEMLCAEHASTIGNNANSMIDMYTENHYARNEQRRNDQTRNLLLIKQSVPDYEGHTPCLRLQAKLHYRPDRLVNSANWQCELAEVQWCKYRCGLIWSRHR